METITIEAKMDMEAVGAPSEAKTEMAEAHFQPPVPVAVEPSESEERDVDNTSPVLVMMAPHSNVCDDRPNTNNSLNGVIQRTRPRRLPWKTQNRYKLAK